nr:hypothetical protein [Halomonas sp.]
MPARITTPPPTTSTLIGGGVVILVLVLHAWLGLRLERQRLQLYPGFIVK